MKEKKARNNFFQGGMEFKYDIPLCLLSQCVRSLVRSGFNRGSPEMLSMDSQRMACARAPTSCVIPCCHTSVVGELGIHQAANSAVTRKKGDLSFAPDGRAINLIFFHIPYICKEWTTPTLTPSGNTSVCALFAKRAKSRSSQERHLTRQGYLAPQGRKEGRRA